MFEEFKDLIKEDKQNEFSQMMQKMIMDRMADNKKDKLERYRHLNKSIRKNQILFVGSSLMEQFPIYELLLDHDLPYVIYNRGIGGYTTSELLDSMDTCIYELEPKKIFINIGTNDLNGPDYKEEELIDRYRTILNNIRTHLPDTKIYIMAYYPVNKEIGMRNPVAATVFEYRTNRRIDDANKKIELLAEEVGATYIDCNDGLKDENGDLKKEYTIDGMHMSGDGYVPVLDKLLPYLSD